MELHVVMITNTTDFESFQKHTLKLITVILYEYIETQIFNHIPHLKFVYVELIQIFFDTDQKFRAPEKK